MTSVRRPRRLRLVLWSALPALLLVGSACSSPAAGPTQEQYAAVADDVCAAAEEKLAELYREQDVAVYTAAVTGESGGTYADRPERWVRAKIVPEYRRLSGSLKGIRPPDGDIAYLRDLYADLDARIETLHRRPGDGRAVINEDALLAERFTSYGITECPV